MTANIWHRLLTQDDGQDIVEYALLATCVGFAAIAGAAFLRAAMNATYKTWDDAIQSDALVEVPDPK